jgi:hypothetical protein
MWLVFLFYVQLPMDLAIATVSGLAFSYLWDWLAPSEAEAPPAARGEPVDQSADREG